MELILLFGIATALLLILAATWFFTRAHINEAKNATVQPRTNRANRLEPVDTSIPRRAQIARNQRHRTQPSTSNAIQTIDSDDSDTEQNRPNPFAEEKIGTKKRAKLEAKAEKRQQREAELQAREERKTREALIEEERKKEQQEQNELDRKQEEAERLALLEQERKEHEEYMKLKGAFQVEEEGYDECDEDEKENLLKTFVNYIRDNKVVILEDLATHFKLKTQAAIDRINDLQENGTLTGVIDDQGKFIYISEKELNDVGEFIRQRGRVSITELVESSNNLINLKPNAGASDEVSASA